MELKKFKIWAEIKIDEFMAENKEEAIKLFWDSISDNYGVSSATEIQSFEEIK